MSGETPPLVEVLVGFIIVSFCSGVIGLDAGFGLTYVTYKYKLPVCFLGLVDNVTGITETRYIYIAFARGGAHLPIAHALRLLFLDEIEIEKK